ncbi:Heterokaryon incompatibility [Penicillium griseofulvum]|uniref:Heterokaryon incompatibility n=1 Tax=Penicillium patulum TaxID=5078 RepID=A0A135LVA0_PENPA|nr:Heterokaryon incompatibility [Penicillium griseofulvum]KXG52876.1 Heterokaryon incompatibility [Penicillium griseofulvum]
MDMCLGRRELEVELSTLAKILLCDQIPLICIETPTQGKKTLSIKPLQASMPYVAISHVWSDGLGNLQRNSLPECQFNRLRDLARSSNLITPEIELIWIDTLCIPPDSADSDNAQRAALQRMREVYEGATAVLVLDYWLTSCHISDLSPSEILMRIFHSNWNRRLWTYQEGAIAKKLIFQFQDSAVDIDDLFQEFLKDRNIFIDLTLRNTLTIKYRSLRHFGRNATGVAEDEALCLATLMGLDMQRVLEYPPKLRMQAFWGMLGDVPSDILLHNGDRMSENGLRWAPKSLLISRSSSNFNHEGRYVPVKSTIGVPFAHITPKGLKFQQSGLVFNVYKTYLGTALWLIDDKRVHHSFHSTFSDQQLLQLKSCYITDEPRKIPAIQPLSAYGTTKLAFISMTVPGPQHGVRKRVGILAAILYESEGVLYGKKIATALDELDENQVPVIEMAKMVLMKN